MKAPKIRFKGENSNYIFWKFEILFSYASEWWTPDTNNKNFYLNWDIPFVKIEDTENKYIKNTKSFITKEWLKHSSAWLIPSNNIIFTNGATVWNVAINKIPVATKQGILWIIPNKNIDKEYMYYLLSNTHFQNEVKNRTAKWTFETIILRNLKEIPISLPSLPEQEKIWSLFEQLDSHISKNQQKLEKLKNMKQSFLQKLFPKDWSALPELRFKGFEGAWEERKLGEICQITMWQSPDWSTYSNKKSDYILVQWNSDLKNWRVVPRIRTTQKTKTANVGDLIMSVRAPAWAIWKTGYDIVLWRWVASIKGNDFVFYFLVKLDTFWYWKRLSAWSTFDSINSDSIQNLNIYFPSLPEQKKIWAFFEKLDTQITHQSQKIQKLQNIKQSLLEKMFI